MLTWSTEGDRVRGMSLRPSVARLLRVSSAVQVADSVRDELLRGDIAPGTRLRDSQLADHLGVSRNTVREGLRILAVEGLVAHSMHHGTVVAELSEADVEDVYRARIALENAGIHAARRAPDGWLASLRAAVDDLAGAEDLDAVAEADLRFHQTVVAASASIRLDRFYRNLQAELRLTRAWAERERGDPAEMTRSHVPVVEALERGEIEAAASLLDEINHQGERRLRDAIKAKQLVKPAIVPVWPPVEEG